MGPAQNLMKNSKHQNKSLKFSNFLKMEEFGVSKQSQDKTPGNSVKSQPSDLDLLFCFECDETFASKSEENRHRCGGDPNVEVIGIDDEGSIDASSSNVEDKKGVDHNFGDIFEEITGDLSENWHPPKVYNSEETGPNILNISDDNEADYEKKSNLEDSFDETTCHLTENSNEKQISDGKSTDNILSSKKDASIPTQNNETNSPKNDENAENIPPRNEDLPE